MSLVCSFIPLFTTRVHFHASLNINLYVIPIVYDLGPALSPLFPTGIPCTHTTRPLFLLFLFNCSSFLYSYIEPACSIVLGSDIVLRHQTLPGHQYPAYPIKPQTLVKITLILPFKMNISTSPYTIHRYITNSYETRIPLQCLDIVQLPYSTRSSKFHLIQFNQSNQSTCSVKYKISSQKDSI